MQCAVSCAEAAGGAQWRAAHSPQCRGCWRCMVACSLQRVGVHTTDIRADATTSCASPQMQTHSHTTDTSAYSMPAACLSPPNSLLLPQQLAHARTLGSRITCKLMVHLPPPLPPKTPFSRNSGRPALIPGEGGRRPSRTVAPHHCIQRSWRATLLRIWQVSQARTRLRIHTRTHSHKGKHTHKHAHANTNT